MTAGRGSIDPYNQVAYTLKLRAARGLWHGGTNPLENQYFDSCRVVERQTGSVVVFTRDEGYHSSGWWKNPDYERCYHLSLSFIGVAGDEVFRLPKSTRMTERWIRTFFGADQNLVWAEPPYSHDGKSMSVWHYRLFCTPDWKPFKPAGEVYNKTWTPAGWLSFSDLQYQREKADAADA